MPIHLVQDVLDQKIRDRREEAIGRVDGIVLEVPDGEAPRVAFLETGGPIPWRRLGPRIGRWARAVRERLGPKEADPARIPWWAVVKVEGDVRVDVDGRGTPVHRWEQWLRDYVVRRIPFAGQGG
ncbi:MAG TPA: hypothetical protein VF771_02575 [Longimicrobiaceae bacterium]